MLKFHLLSLPLTLKIMWAKEKKKKRKKPQIYPSAESPEKDPCHNKEQLHMFVATSDFPLGQMMTWKAVLWMILTLYNPKLMCVFES
jgi:hypothetical protein